LTARPLTTGESGLVRWLLAHQMPNDAKAPDADLSTALVSLYDESGCLRFVRPTSSDELGFSSNIHTFVDLDGVPITAFLTFDPHGNMQELDLWKADDSAILGLRDSFP
jgi:hypothetical protein